MRVLFVISGLGLGGAERQVVLLARELAKRGHAACIYVLTRHRNRVDELAGSTVELVLDSKRVRLDPGVLWRLRRHIANWRPDVVHGFLYDGNLYSRLASAGSGLPILNSERSDNYNVSTLQTLGYRLTAGLADGVVANSHAGADFARRIHGSRSGDLHVVWNGIDLAEIDSRLARAGRVAHDLVPGDGLKRACIVGTIKPPKDYLLALRVMRRLADADPAWRLLCVGDEATAGSLDYKARVLAERDRLGLQSIVGFIGMRRDVPEIVASCDALLVTSLHEGFPNVVLEAMACGTPVASTEYSDVRRILPMAWQVVASRDEAELATALARCHAERAPVAAAQRRWVESNATIAKSADTLLAIYTHCASNGQPAIAEKTS